MLAKELLNKPDGFLSASYGEEEYIVDGIKRTSTEGNWDDTSLYWTLIIQKCRGNIKR
jgi:hypothetical protein